MPAQELSHRFQTAVLWEWTGTDRYGEPTHSAPVEIKVRWTWKRSGLTSPTGDTESLDATVTVDRNIPEGSLMWLGTLEDWYGTGSAGRDDELMQVATSAEVPDVKNRVSARQVGLKRFRQKLP